MIPEVWDRLRPFRDEAMAQGIPADDVERWLTTARPCVTLQRAEDGAEPVVGRFGGPLLLPVDVPTPQDPFVASIDLAALPVDGTDLPLPPDGHLLFFAWPETRDRRPAGTVVYVPAGAAVTERDKSSWNSRGVAEYGAMFESYPQGPLRARVEASLPYHSFVALPGDPGYASLPGHPRCGELVEVWQDIQPDIAPGGPLQIGGYADEEAVEFDPVAVAASIAAKAVRRGHWDGPVSADSADWVLLADWYAGRCVEGWEGSTVHWVIQREDLAARRFGCVYTTVFWNP
ncbi:DUF1963 domain-containing protein [Streptomyces hirsutus]|uniref:DUF1963 domain-containing protein n=1 Tax=Streptomyces hirsutus TaxID=35620 RepID=UPI0007C78452|nr:DUF1963 domain-containing protein [Streptomyces hirsutus]